MKNKVIAISGYPGSGKTTICESIINERKDFIYFDFGFLFRPLTYYLFNELELTEEEIRKLIDNNILFEKIKFSYKLKGNKVSIGVNNHFYTEEELFNPKMNMDTVTVGTIIGDRLTHELRKIVDELKIQGNVLLNARRPVEAYPNLDCHIFLQADFNKRLERKINMNGEDYQVTRSKLLKRDAKEKESGFWQIFDFTEIIDTTNLTLEEAIKTVQKYLDKSKIRFTYINNLTLVLGSYKCNKNCPYCIAKNNKKFCQNDSLYNLDRILNDLVSGDIRLKRFVISGNGEPSMYDYQDLLKIKNALEKNHNLFKSIRLHSSGNIFFEEDKFDLFNSMNLPLEFEVLRVSLDSELDMKVLGYDQDYLKSSLLERSKSIKCDIAFTDYLDFSNIKEDLDEFLKNNPNITKIRFKKLLAGDKDTTKQAEWVRKHSLSDDVILKILEKLGLKEINGVYTSSDGRIIYKLSGDYDNDIVINDGEITDYNYNKYNVKMLKRRFGEQ